MSEASPSVLSHLETILAETSSSERDRSRLFGFTALPQHTKTRGRNVPTSEPAIVIKAKREKPLKLAVLARSLAPYAVKISYDHDRLKRSEARRRSNSEGFNGWHQNAHQKQNFQDEEPGNFPYVRIASYPAASSCLFRFHASSRPSFSRRSSRNRFLPHSPILLSRLTVSKADEFDRRQIPIGESLKYNAEILRKISRSSSETVCPEMIPGSVR